MAKNGIKLYPKTREEVVTKYNDGATVNQLAKRYGVSKTTIITIVRPHIKQIIKYKQDLTPDEKDYVIRNFLCGVPAKEIASKMYIPLSRLYKIVKEYKQENNIKDPPKRVKISMTKTQYNTSILMYSRGCSKIEIGLKLKLDYWIINDTFIKREQGIKNFEFKT